LRFDLYPLDLYVRHTSAVLNTALKYLLPLLEPTRYDRTLRQFPNYSELHGDLPVANVIPPFWRQLRRQMRDYRFM
jgi:hypothetical protein